MTYRTPRHSAVVDFIHHNERRWVVLEEDHVKVEKERDQLQTEVEALRKDANRYRWLRDHYHGFEHYSA